MFINFEKVFAIIVENIQIFPCSFLLFFLSFNHTLLYCFISPPPPTIQYPIFFELFLFLFFLLVFCFQKLLQTHFLIYVCFVQLCVICGQVNKRRSLKIYLFYFIYLFSNVAELQFLLPPLFPTPPDPLFLCFPSEKSRTPRNIN